MEQIAKRPVMTVKEFSEESTLGLTVCYKLIREGVIQHRKVGGRILISRKWFDDWINGSGEYKEA